MVEDHNKDALGFRARIFALLLVIFSNKCAGLELYDIRLVNGENQFQGRLEVHALFGPGLGYMRWWSVCSDDFNWDAADVACRQLGYEHGAYDIHKNNYFQPSTDLWQISVKFSCSGSEYTLDSCEFHQYFWWQWECNHNSDVGLTCNACGDPGMPVNALLQVESYTLGSQARYTCKEGTLVGDEVLVCQEDGTWKGTLPTCLVESPAIMCGTPAEIPHGSISGREELLIGADIIYSCLPGYNLVGMATRTCLETAVWSGDAPQCKIVECTDPGLPEGAVREPVESFRYDSALVYNCSEGYMLPENTSESALVLMCLEDGSWSKPLPICIEVTEIDKNGGASLSLNNSKGIIVAVIMGVLLFLTSIIIAVVLYKRRLLSKFCALFSKERKPAQSNFNNVLYDQRENLYAEPSEVRAPSAPPTSAEGAGGQAASAPPISYHNHVYNQIQPVHPNHRTDRYEDLRPRQASPYTQLDQSMVRRLDSSEADPSLAAAAANTYDEVDSPGYQDPSQWQGQAENIYSDVESLSGYQDPAYALPATPPPTSPASPTPGSSQYEEVPDDLGAPASPEKVSSVSNALYSSNC